MDINHYNHEALHFKSVVSKNHGNECYHNASLQRTLHVQIETYMKKN